MELWKQLPTSIIGLQSYLRRPRISNSLATLLERTMKRSLFSEMQERETIMSVVSTSVVEPFQRCEYSRYLVIQYGKMLFHTIIAAFAAGSLSPCSVHNFQHAVRLVVYRLLHHSERVKLLLHLLDFRHATTVLIIFHFFLIELFLVAERTSLQERLQ